VPTTTTTTTLPPNVAPVAVDDAWSVPTLSVTNIPVLANDDDPDGTLVPATLQITSGPTAGSASVSAGRIRYTAPLLGPLLSPNVSIGYRICDDRGACDDATLRITVTLL
jgi:hypothetical protein